MTDEDTRNEKTTEKCVYFDKFRKLFEKKPKRVAIFTHASPDPDAIGSIMAIEWLMSKAFDVESDKFYAGAVSHPQNRCMVALVEPNLKPVDECKPEAYDFFVLVDTVPANAGVGGLDIKFNLVIDHHKEVPNGGFNGLFINLKAGSCCGTVYNLIKKMGLRFDENDQHDRRVATAIMVGITTDTEGMMAKDTSDLEFEAWAELFPARNADDLVQIVNYDMPTFWIDLLSDTPKLTTTVENVSIVGLGILPSRHRDVIAEAADNIIRREGVTTAVAFAIVDGHKIEGCVRAKTDNNNVSGLCKELACKFNGNGGGKQRKGGYRYELGSGGFDEEDDEETKKKTWELFNDKETKRILRILKPENRAEKKI